MNDQFKPDSNDSLYYILLLLVNPLFSLLRGTKNNPSLIGVRKCGKKDFTIVVGYVMFLVYIARHLKSLVFERNFFTRANIANIEFNEDNTKKLMISMFVVGFTGSFLSAGSAALITFSLIMIKMTPFAASPTALSITILFGISSSFICYLEGLIYMSATLIGGLFVVVSTLIVRLTIYETFVKQGKASMLLLFIGIMMGVSTIAGIFQVGPIIYKEYMNGVNIFLFHSIC